MTKCTHVDCKRKANKIFKCKHCNYVYCTKHRYNFIHKCPQSKQYITKERTKHNEQLMYNQTIAEKIIKI